jgi:hypothetical protein
MRVARERVGAMFSMRLGSLMVRQVSAAYASASSSGTSVYLRKYESGPRNAVARSRRNRSRYHRRMSAVRASTYTEKSK